MSTTEHLDDQIIGRYLDQPLRLPADLRRQIEAAWDGAPVQLYALSDLDHTLRLGRLIPIRMRLAIEDDVVPEQIAVAVRHNAAFGIERQQELLAFLALTCGLVLDSVARGRREAKRMAYLAAGALQSRPHATGDTAAEQDGARVSPEKVAKSKTTSPWA